MIYFGLRNRVLFSKGIFFCGTFITHEDLENLEVSNKRMYLCNVTSFFQGRDIIGRSEIFFENKVGALSIVTWRNIGQLREAINNLVPEVLVSSTQVFEVFRGVCSRSRGIML